MGRFSRLSRLPNDQIRAELSDRIYQNALRKGKERHDRSQERGYAGVAECEPDLPQDEQAACGEAAFAIMLGIPPNITVDNGKDPDVAGYQVRSTTKPGHGLLVRPGDADDQEYVLMVGQDQAWRCAGKKLGKHCKRPEYWQNPGKRGWCWIAPQEDVDPFDPTALRPQGALQEDEVLDIQPVE